MTSRGKAYIAPILLTLLLSGCQAIPPETLHNTIFQQEPLTEQQLADWLEDGEYMQALSALRAQPDITEDDPRLQRVRQHIARHQKALISDIKQLLKRDQWHEAQRLLDESRGKLPESDKLKAINAAVDRQRQQQLLGAQMEEAVLRAAWLHSRIALQQQLLMEEEGYFNRLKHQQLLSERSELIDTLIELANEAVQSHPEQARQCYAAAQQLLPMSQNSPRLAELAQRLENDSQEYKQEQRRQETELRKSLSQAMQQQHYSKASHLGERLRHQPELEQASRKLLKQLEQQLAQRVQQLDRSGDAHYVKGNVEQASSLWSKALELQPDNRPIQDKLLRAKRVLNNLRELRR